MERERQWSLTVIVVLSVALLISAWLEDDDTTEGSSKTPLEVVMATANHIKTAMTSLDRRTYNRKNEPDSSSHETENSVETRWKEGGETVLPLSKHRVQLNDKSSISSDLYSCLPRFICEVHAEPPGARLTDLETDIIGLFRNYVVLEGPGSPVYKYQFAAHMGQLVTGLDPSPCHQLYPSCPLSRIKLLEVLASVKGARKIFH